MIRPSPGSRAPASEWSAVSSSDFLRRSGRGASIGIRSARLVLPAPLGPESRIGVPAGGGDLGGVLGVGHAAQVGEVDLARVAPRRARSAAATRHRRHRRRRRAPARRAARRPPARATACRSTVMPGTIAASRACGSGTKTCRMPRSVAASTIGSTPGTERSPPSSVSSPMNAVPIRARAGTVPSAARTATATARSKCGPRLVRSAGDSRTVIAWWPASPDRCSTIAIRHRSALLAQRLVGAPDHEQAGLPGRDVGLDVDEVAQGAVQRHAAGGRARHRTEPRTCSTSAGPRRGRITATRSTRVSSGRDAVLDRPPLPEPVQPVELGVGDRLVRRAVASAGAGLHLAHHQHGTVAQHEVDLPLGAPPVAVEQDEPPVRAGGTRPPARRRRRGPAAPGGRCPGCPAWRTWVSRSCRQGGRRHGRRRPVTTTAVENQGPVPAVDGSWVAGGPYGACRGRAG